MSEIVPLGAEGEVAGQGSLYDRTSLIEKALVAITSIGIALALTEITFMAVAFFSPFPTEALVSKVTAFFVWFVPAVFFSSYCNLNPYFSHNVAHTNDSLYLMKSEDKDYYHPTICQLKGLDLSSKVNVWVSARPQIHSPPYVVLHWYHEGVVSIYDFMHHSVSKIDFPKASRVDVLKNMLLSLEEGNLQVRDFKGSLLLSFESGLVDFCVCDNKIITFSSTDGMKVYDLFSPVHQLIPRVLGKELGVQFQYQFPYALQKGFGGNATPIGFRYIYFGNGLIQYDTGKMWRMKDLCTGVVPIMVDEDTIAYQANGKTVLYRLSEEKRVEVPCESEVEKLGAYKKYLFILDEGHHLTVWDTRDGEIKQAKKEIGEKVYADFVIGNQNTGILAIQTDGVTPFWEDGGAYQRAVPVEVMEFSANNG